MAAVEPVEGLVTDLEGFQELLDRYPTAVIAAINANALLVPLPDGLRLSRQRVLASRSLIDWVVVEDRARIARAWFETRRVGWVRVAVRLLSDPDRWLSLHFVRTADAAGLVLAALVPDGVDGGSFEQVPIEAARSRLASYRQDNAGVIIDCDERSATMLGFTVDQLVASQGLDLVHPDDQADVIEAWVEAMATRRTVTMRYRHSYGEGGWIWVDGTIHNFLGQPDRDHILVELIDVSEAMAAKDALEARELLLNRLTEALPVGVFQVDPNQVIVYSNARLQEILGTPVSGGLPTLLAAVDAADRDALQALVTAALNGGLDGDLDVGTVLRDGELRRCLMSVRPLVTRTAGVAGAIVCVSDTTESVRMRQELEDRATFDVLTRCHNRASVMVALQQAIDGSQATGVGVLFIDIDRFKPVNDLLGHAAGDELLVAVAGRIDGCLRERDMLGRIGGDEFLVVCPGTVGAGDLLRVATRISESMQSAVHVAGEVLTVRTSIGAACWEAGMTADDVVAVADDAMYESKRLSRGLPVLGETRAAAALAAARSGVTRPTRSDRG
jgi:diguanylate cyclase (GGDEF)-like protein/PAS domain S-box-containing protein